MCDDTNVRLPLSATNTRQQHKSERFTLSLYEYQTNVSSSAICIDQLIRIKNVLKLRNKVKHRSQYQSQQ